MNKPKIFISSTVYDFQDLRSALKYWLEELGYEVLMSESSDFAKDSSKNSYDACLAAINECDYFILLIGDRVGGWYDKNISITRKEYQTAYAAARQGRIKRIISFIRRHIWDVIEDRQVLVKVLEKLDVKENSQLVDKKEIAYHDTKLVKGAEHIKNFLDEVTRKNEFKEGNKPTFNWINIFQSFEDIVKVLTVELSLKVDIAGKVAERNIKTALARNLTSLTEKGKGGIIANFLSFYSIRNQLAAERETAIKNPLDYQICLDRKQIPNVFEAAFFYEMGVYELDVTVLEAVINSGDFLVYNTIEEKYIETGVCRALKDMIYEIKHLQRHISKIDNGEREYILKLTQEYKDYNENTQCDYPYHQLANFVVPFDCKYNILELTKYIFKCFNKQDYSLDYPLMLHGLTNAGHPTEKEILDFFEN